MVKMEEQQYFLISVDVKDAMQVRKFLVDDSTQKMKNTRSFRFYEYGSFSQFVQHFSERRDQLKYEKDKRLLGKLETVDTCNDDSAYFSPEPPTKKPLVVPKRKTNTRRVRTLSSSDSDDEITHNRIIQVPPKPAIQVPLPRTRNNMAQKKKLGGSVNAKVPKNKAPKKAIMSRGVKRTRNAEYPELRRMKTYSEHFKNIDADSLISAGNKQAQKEKKETYNEIIKDEPEEPVDPALLDFPDELLEQESVVPNDQFDVVPHIELLGKVDKPSKKDAISADTFLGENSKVQNPELLNPVVEWRDADLENNSFYENILVEHSSSPVVHID